jgi:hypothetical protein
MPIKSGKTQNYYHFTIIAVPLKYATEIFWRNGRNGRNGDIFLEKPAQRLFLKSMCYI